MQVKVTMSKKFGTHSGAEITFLSNLDPGPGLGVIDHKKMLEIAAHKYEDIDWEIVRIEELLPEKVFVHEQAYGEWR